MQIWNLLQWPAMVVTVTACWMVASEQPRRREIGFWVFVASNLLWVAWGIPAKAWGVVGLQACLFVLNLRGVRKAEHAERQQAARSG